MAKQREKHGGRKASIKQRKTMIIIMQTAHNGNENSTENGNENSNENGNENKVVRQAKLQDNPREP